MAAPSSASTTSRLILRPITHSISTAKPTPTSHGEPLAHKSSGSPSAAVIVGIAVGSMVALGIIALLILECIFRKRWTLLRCNWGSSTRATGEVTMLSGHIISDGSEGTTVVGSHSDDNTRRMSQLSKSSEGSGRSQKIKFGDQATVRSVV